MKLEEINIPEQDNPAWVVEQLRTISRMLNKLYPYVGNDIYDVLETCNAHIEALREYVGIQTEKKLCK